MSTNKKPADAIHTISPGPPAGIIPANGPGHKVGQIPTVKPMKKQTPPKNPSGSPHASNPMPKITNISHPKSPGYPAQKMGTQPPLKKPAPPIKHRKPAPVPKRPHV